MAHDHHHAKSAGHSHHHEATTLTHINLVFGLAVFLNALFVIVEGIFAIQAHSMSLLADAGHNLGDVLGLLFSWLASWLLTKAATERYSYGFKRTSIYAALTNALILVATSAIIAYESIKKFYFPVPLHEMTIIAIAFIGIFINGGTALLFMRGRHQDLNLRSAFLHLSYDALIALGVVITGIIIHITGWQQLDPLVGLLIVVTILFGTRGLLRDSVNLMLDAVPHHVNQQAVRAYLSNLAGVKAVHDLHIWGLSTNDIALTVHLIIPDGELNDADYQQINRDLYQTYRINHVTIQVERTMDPNFCKQIVKC